jgi:dephospho-CoA kinase
MLKVGLTGNIGSGKTLVAGIFSAMGIPVFHADTEARKLFDEEDIKDKIREVFGDQAFSLSGDVNRQALAEIVFSDENLLTELNNIIHPVVRVRYRQWCLMNADKPYTLYEAAILFESGHYKEMDKVICVTAPELLRIKRVTERDGITVDEVKKRMANQWEEEKKVQLADFVINNDGDQPLEAQVLAIHEQLEVKTVGR